MDKFALEGKVKELETKIKEQTKKITDLTEATNTSKQVKSHSNNTQMTAKIPIREQLFDRKYLKT